MGRIFVSETYVVEDCIDYQPLTSNAHQSRWSIPSAVTSASIFGYSSDGWTFGNANSYSRIIHQTNLSQSFSLEYKLTAFTSSNNQPPLANYFYSNGSTPNVGVIRYTSGKWSIAGTEYTASLNAGDVIRIDFTSSTIALYVNDVLVAQKSHSVSYPTKVEFHTGSTRQSTIKDFKIKPL